MVEGRGNGVLGVRGEFGFFLGGGGEEVGGEEFSFCWREGDCGRDFWVRER